MGPARLSSTPLQLIFSFFLALMVVAFVGVGVSTFHPGPTYPQDLEFVDQPSTEQQAAIQAYRVSEQQWALSTSIILLICATVIMVISLIRSQRLQVLADGLLLGGVFTMVYSVGMSLGGSQSLARFVVVSIALVATVAVGYLRFTRTTDAALASGARAGVGPAPTSADHDLTQLPNLAQRVTSIEATLHALASALQSRQD
ncbi:MAG: hypothetical protein WCG47_04235 [Dermatophilaceae bacterium]